ncbi:hypothetical protein L3Y34_011382 [Caenorhabditis briggsae]|uniref:Uncharacterized protein n=1 Tax=Caenorhabditis briggsae TaxID=6238 RepID=A0AAE9CUE2_CAEBR|nr:hypothetical protein L3Y34_011382 [Caenorhabditis briggsae]
MFIWAPHAFPGLLVKGREGRRLERKRKPRSRVEFYQLGLLNQSYNHFGAVCMGLDYFYFSELFLLLIIFIQWTSVYGPSI